MSPEAARDAAISVFAKLGGELVDPPILMPASIPLELSGETVRARLCVFTGEDGEEVALRPDLTLAIARAELDARRLTAAGERILRYAARAFRLPADAGQPLEFTQVGFERFGGPAGPEADAEAFAIVFEAARAAGAPKAEAWFGDLSVFPAIIRALDLPDGAARALERAFRQAGGVKARLRAETAAPAHGLAARLAGADWDEAEAVVRDVLRIGGITPVGARGVDEIVARLLDQSTEGDLRRIDVAARQALEAILDVECDLAAAADALSKIAAAHGLAGLDPVFDGLQRRAELIGEIGGDAFASATFGTPFGRRFNYYDGFLFELFRPGDPHTSPFAAGGRYDSLLGLLSQGEIQATALGGIVRPDRLSGDVA